MREGSTLTYLHGDHLGSASLATDGSGAVVGEMRYTPYGVTRSGTLDTDRRYTGQRWEASLGLYDYGARFYSPGLGRFVSADTVVPGAEEPQALNRYAYVSGNPLKYTDPSGHWYGPDAYDPAGIETIEEEISFWHMHYALFPEGGSAVQVDLDTWPKISQYAPEIIDNPDYRYNTCGLIAAAYAMGGEDYLTHMRRIYEASTHTDRPYNPDKGIQPTPYVQALKEVYGEDKVAAYDGWRIGDLYAALQGGEVVIVDIQVGTHRNSQGEVPTTKAPNVAHFARVFGLDWRKDAIYIENTLSGKPYWQISLTEFAQVWQYPEVRVSFFVEEAEEVTQWAVVITR